nr:hypothetical protein [Kordiimonas lacus]
MSKTDRSVPPNGSFFYDLGGSTICLRDRKIDIAAFIYVRFKSGGAPLVSALRFSALEVNYPIMQWARDRVPVHDAFRQWGFFVRTFVLQREDFIVRCSKQGYLKSTGVDAAGTASRDIVNMANKGKDRLDGHFHILLEQLGKYFLELRHLA